MFVKSFHSQPQFQSSASSSQAATAACNTTNALTGSSSDTASHLRSGGSSHTDVMMMMMELRFCKWQNALFDCLDECIPNTLLAYCCSWISMAQIAVRVGVITSYGRALVGFGIGAFLQWVFSTIAPSVYCRQVLWLWFTPSFRWAIHEEPIVNAVVNPQCLEDGNGGLLTKMLILYLITWSCFSMTIALIRRQIRQRFQIPGDFLGDCVVSCCCQCCGIAQMASHVKSYPRGKCTVQAPKVLPAYEL